MSSNLRMALEWENLVDQAISFSGWWHDTAEGRRYSVLCPELEWREVGATPLEAWEKMLRRLTDAVHLVRVVGGG